jgi:hypothetical protein
MDMDDTDSTQQADRAGRAHHLDAAGHRALIAGPPSPALPEDDAAR